MPLHVSSVRADWSTNYTRQAPLCSKWHGQEHRCTSDVVNSQLQMLMKSPLLCRHLASCWYFIPPHASIHDVLLHPLSLICAYVSTRCFWVP